MRHQGPLAARGQVLASPQASPRPPSEPGARKPEPAAAREKIFQVLVQVAKTLLETEELNDVLNTVMDIIFKYLPVERGLIILFDDDGNPVPKLTKFREGADAQDIPISRTILNMVAQQQVALTRWAPKAPLEFAALIEETTEPAEYSNLRFPVLLMRGERAPTPTRLITERLIGLLPNARLVVISGAGHMGPFTHRSEVNALIVAHTSEQTRAITLQAG